MKKILIPTSLFIVAVVVVLFFFLLVLSPEKKHYTTMSQRTLSYIQQQKNRGDPLWLPVNFDETSTESDAVLGSSRIRIPDCFAFDIPFALKSGKKTGECAYKYYFDSPAGFMSITASPSMETDLKEISAVVFRRFDPKSYTEKAYQTSHYSFVLFKKNSDLYEQTAFRLFGGRLFTMSFVISTNDNLDSTFLDVINSVDFLY